MTLEKVAVETFGAGRLLLFPPYLDLNCFQKVGCGLDCAPGGNEGPLSDPGLCWGSLVATSSGSKGQGELSNVYERQTHTQRSRCRRVCRDRPPMALCPAGSTGGFVGSRCTVQIGTVTFTSREASGTPTPTPGQESDSQPKSSVPHSEAGTLSSNTSAVTSLCSCCQQAQTAEPERSILTSQPRGGRDEGAGGRLNGVRTFTSAF